MGYAYKEFLRARKVLTVLGIVLVAAFALALVLRIAHPSDRVQIVGDAGDIRSSATTHVTRTTLPSGHVRTVVDDPVKHVHAVFESNADRTGGESLLGASAAVDVGMFLGVAVLVSLIVATIMAATFCYQNRGHLEMAFMWPQPRERNSLAAIGVDIAAVSIALLMGAVAAFAISELFVRIAPEWTPQTIDLIALSFVGPVAWYALLLAATASLRGGFGIVSGVAWAVSFILIPTAQLPVASGGSLLALLVTTSRVLAHLDPLAYLRLSSETAHGGIAGSAQAALLYLVPLTLIYLAAAVVQWRRVEA